MSQLIKRHVRPLRRAVLVGVVAGLVSVALPAGVSAEPAPVAAVLGEGGPDGPGRVHRRARGRGPVRARRPRARGLAREFSGTLHRTFEHAVTGFSVAMSAADARRLSKDPAVAYVEANQRVRLADVQSPTPSWGLDRSTSAPYLWTPPTPTRTPAPG